MRMRNPKDKDLILEQCDFYYNKETGFNNENPVHLEIGMGKGDFLIGMALKYPNINFIGVEKYSSVASVAIKKIRNYSISNLRVMIIDAINLPEYLKKNIDTIYLNFSDPWPKKRHAMRRLTSLNFLEIYDKVFMGDAHIIMKTDNEGLFNYSIESLKKHGYIFKKVVKDLHSTKISNVMTEYEKKFTLQGIPIKYLEAIKK